MAFAATGALALGATATVLAALRWLEPEVFVFAPRLLDRRLGMFAVAGVLAAAVCGALAAWCATISRGGIACGLIVAASAAGAGVLVIHALETPSVRRNAGFVAPNAGKAAAKSVPAERSPRSVDAAHGKTIYYGTCAACHGPDLAGLRGQGASLRDSEFVHSKSDGDLLAFVKVGRQPFDPDSKLHLAMPARGGNPALGDADLVDALAFIRTTLKEAPASSSNGTGTPGTKADSGGTAPPAGGDHPAMLDGRLWLPHSVIQAAAAGPAGVKSETVALQHPGARSRSTGVVKKFFSLVFFTNALQAFYLLCGIGLGGVAVTGVIRKTCSTQAVALVAGYWMVVGALCLVTASLLYVTG